MKITIEFDSAEQAVAALRGVGGNSGPVASAPLPAAAPYAPPQAAPQYQPQQAPANAYEPPAQQPQPQQAPSGITSGQVAAAAQAYAKVHGPKGAKAKLAEFGITKIIDAQPHQYPDMLRAFAA